MKIEVHPQGGQRRVIELEPGATKGATVGVNVWNQDGTLFVPQTAAPEEGGPPITYWRLILEIPPNVVALAETITTGLYVITGDGTSETRAIQATPGETTVSNGDGVAADPAVGLADVEDSGEGALLAITRDSKGRVTGTRAATITGTAGEIDVANGDAVAGLPTISLADVADAGGGTLQRTEFDAKGRKTGTSAATTDDLAEGSSNLYFTDARADARITAQKGQPGGLATLDGDAKLEANQLPALAITDTFVVNTEAAMLALDAQQGDVAVRTDEQKSYILTADPASTLANWQELLTPTGTGGTVTSVALSVPTGLTVSGSPITSSGTITVSYDTGYQGYTSSEASKLSGIASGATVGADWNINLSNIPANIAAWAGITPAAKADASALSAYLPLAGGVLSGNLFYSTSAFSVRATTSPGSDNAQLALSASPGLSVSRGAFLTMHGVNHPSFPGDVLLTAGNGGALTLTAPVGSSVRPGNDNSISSGTGALRWSVVYAGTGAINTSDAREKTPVRPMDSQEIAAAMELAAEIGTYQWLDAIAEKGDDARLHVGMTVQRAIEIMDAHDLNPYAYGFICYDRWDERPEIVEDGEIVQPHLPAGDRYSFRMDQLCLFLARGQEERLRRLEQAVGL